MKKALVLALTVLMVLSLATAVFAVEATYEGDVKVKWANNPAAEEDATGFSADTVEFTLKFDVVKEYSDEVSAGLTVKTSFDNDDDGAARWDDMMHLVDKNAWIKLDYELVDVTAFTADKGAAGKDFKEFDMARAAGVKADLALIEGLTVTGLVNNGFGNYGILAKGEYAADLFTVGGGFQSEKTGDKTSKTALAAYGSFNPMENLTVKGEFGNRKAGAVEDEDAITAILAGAKYDDGALVLDGAFLMSDIGFQIQSDDDASEWLARDVVKAGLYKASVVYADASYAVTDALKVLGSVDYILKAEDAAEEEVDLKEFSMNLSYKAGLEYQLTEALKAEGWFKGYGKFADDKAHSQFGGKATYTFAEGVDGSFELTNGRGADDPEAYTRYKAMISAKF